MGVLETSPKILYLLFVCVKLKFLTFLLHNSITRRCATNRYGVGLILQARCILPIVTVVVKRSLTIHNVQYKLRFQKPPRRP